MNTQPIGFIDSGFGGLTVVKEALKQLPNESVCFLGDSARCPYGPRTQQEVKAFTWEMVRFLQDKNIKMLVIACNTATAAALPELRKQLNIPVIGVIEPGSRAAIKESKNHNIGVIGTQGTIASGVYETMMKQKNAAIHVHNLACPSFVEIVEKNQTKTDTTTSHVQEVLSFFQDTKIDTLILGCTHYPLLKEAIQESVGKDVTLIDSGVETITDVSSVLDYFNLSAPQESQVTHRFFTTGDVTHFKEVAQQWLAQEVHVEHVDLSEYKQEEKMKEKTLLIATKNKGKAVEFEEIFGQKGYTVKTLLDYPDIEDVAETGVTFEENARLKAETISQLLQVPVIADDSGLMVDALDGQPGVYSARYAGEPKNDAANNAKLLATLAEMPNVSRKAKFHCTLVFARPNEESIVVHGELHGEIATVPVGDGGFGYDPLFYVPELGKTTAQLGSEKHKISHRKKAVQALMEKLNELGE